jgi:hypothetical protein
VSIFPIDDIAHLIMLIDSLVWEGGEYKFIMHNAIAAKKRSVCSLLVWHSLDLVTAEIFIVITAVLFPDCVCMLKLWPRWIHPWCRN